jgi:phage-related baseplate assembly protein
VATCVVASDPDDAGGDIMNQLPEPEFVERDAAKVLRECVAFVETWLERPLEPDQFERLMVDLVVYREMIVREQINEAAKQNLVAFARYPMIDYLATMVGFGRLPAAKARTPLQFTFASPLVTSLPIPQGFRIRSKDAKVTFGTLSEITLAPGSTGVTLTGECLSPGSVGNSYAPGQISEPVDSLAVTFTVSNSATSAGGGPSEDTERLRERFPSAVRALSVAGPFSAYEHLARTASADVLDARAVSLVPFVMTVYVLAVTGAPDAPLLELVAQKLNPVDGRPGLDQLEVVAATPVSWALSVEIVLRKDRIGVAETAADLAATQAAAAAYAALLRGGLEREVVRSQLFAALQLPNNYSVNIVAPVSGGVALAQNQWAECTSILVAVVGYEGDP